MSDEDNKKQEPSRQFQSHSPTSVLLVVVLFIAAMYSVNVVKEHYDAKKAVPTANALVVAPADRVCDSYKGSKTPPAIPAFAWKNTGLITLWFDDGWLTQYTAAYPIMQQEGLVGALAVATGFVCKGAFVTWDNLHTMQDHGWEMTSHTISHSCDLSYYNKETTAYELGGAKKILEEHGLRADNFVMPCGFGEVEINSLYGISDKAPPIIAVAKQYYQSYRTTAAQRLNSIPILDAYNLKALQVRNDTSIKTIQEAINLAIKNKNWLVLVFHQVDDSNQMFSIPVAEFKQILGMVKASGLPVVLPTQALKIRAAAGKTEKASLTIVPGQENQ